MVPVLFGILGLFGAAAVLSSEEKGQSGGFGAVSYSMGGRGRGTGAGAASSMGGRQVGIPYDWDTPSGTLMRWDRRGGVFGATSLLDLAAANQDSVGLIQSFGGHVLRTGEVELEGLEPGFYTEARFKSLGAAQQTANAAQRLAKRYGAVGDCIWLSAGHGHYFILWTTDASDYLSHWMEALNESGGELMDIEEVFGDEDFGFMLFGIPFGRESRITSLEGKIERAEEKISSLGDEAKEDGADLEWFAKKIARYEQKKEKWEDRLETLQMKGESMGFDDHDDDDDDDEFGAFWHKKEKRLEIVTDKLRKLADAGKDEGRKWENLLKRYEKLGGDEDEDFSPTTAAAPRRSKVVTVREEDPFADLEADIDSDLDDKFGFDDYFAPGPAYGKAIDDLLDDDDDDDEFGYTSGAIGSYDLLGDRIAGEMFDVQYGYSGGAIGSYDLLGDRIAREMFEESFGRGLSPHVGHQRTAIELGEHILS